MTGPEIIASFKQYYDRVTSFSAPGYIDAEILRFLNAAQDEIIDRRVFGKGFQPPGFEDMEKRVADLFSLVKYVDITYGVVYNGNYGNSYFYPKDSVSSDRVLYTIRVDARVTRTRPTQTNEYVWCDRIRTENAGKFVSNRVNRTHFIHPKYVEDTDGYHIIVDYYTTTLDRLKFTIVLKPYPITATIGDYNIIYGASYMSLPSHVHQDIVDLAVEKAMLTTGDQRWQGKVAEGAQNTN